MKFCICGDFAPKKIDTALQYEGDIATARMLNGELEEMLSDLHPELSASDVNMLNVETTLLLEGAPIVKNGAILVDHPQWASFLSRNGFNVGLLANNHIGDCGPEGTLKTIDVLQKAGIMTVGAGKDKQAAEETLYVTKNGETMAIINACEHEYGLAGKDKAGAMHSEPFTLIAKIREAKQRADFVAVILHGGSEHIAIPSPRLKTLLRGLADNGADLVVNNHPHCPMAYEVYQGVPIFYSMGNFVFGFYDGNGMWKYGYMISGEWKNGKIAFEIIPYLYENEKLRRFYGEEKEYFLRYIETLQKYSFDEETAREIWLSWCKHNGDFFDGVAARNIHFRKNSYNCEAHSEVLGTYYEEIIENNRPVDEKYWELLQDLMQYKI